MTTHKLAAYEIKIRRKGDRNSYFNLSEMNNIPGLRAYESYSEFMEEFLLSYVEESPETDESRKRTFTVKDVERNDQKVTGRIASGEYGEVNDHWNVINEERDEDAREYYDAEERKFFFHTSLNDNIPSESAFLFLERFKNFGAKTDFQEKLRKEIKDLNGDLILEINPIFTKTLISRLAEAESLLSFIIESPEAPEQPQNLEERVNDERIPTTHQMRQTIELKPAQGNISYSLDEVQEWVENDNIPFFRMYNFEISDVKVKVRESGSERRISISEGNSLKMTEILEPEDEDIEIVDGRVTDESLENRAELLEDELADLNREDKVSNF